MIRRPILMFVTMLVMLAAYAGAALAAPVNEAEPNDSFGQAQNLDRYFDLSSDSNIANSTTVPHATVNGTGNNTHDYYSFTVPQAGVAGLGVFDIDGAMPSFDSYLQLYDASGNLLSANDDASLDPGSQHRYDSYLQYTFPQAGTYYIKVGQCCTPNPVPSSAVYNLNVSVPNHSVPPPDTAAPTVAISNPASGSTLSGTNTVSANASDNVEVRGVQFKLDGSDLGGEDIQAPHSASWDTTSVADGNHTLTAVARDAAGNTTTSEPISVTVDNTAPVATIDSAPSGYTVSTSANFSFSSEEGATFACKLDDEPDFVACSSPKEYTNLTDGPRTFSVRATDGAGNTVEISRNWMVDTALPDTTITSGPEGLTSDNAPSFSFGGSDTGSAEADLLYSHKLDSGEWSEYASGTSVTLGGANGLADGPHALAVKSKDQAGNEDPTPAERSFTVDASAPPTTISSGPSGTVRANSASFAFSSEDGARLRCKFDGEENFSDCTSPKAFADLANGAHTFHVRAVDVAGNVGPATSRTWTVDTTLPNTTITSGPSGSVKSNSASFSFTSEGSDFRCSLDGGPYSECNPPRSYFNLANGTHTFKVKATDVPGNTTPAVRTWIVDTVLPTVSGMYPRNASTTTDVTPTIKATVGDNLTNLQKANMKLYVNGVLISPTKYSYSAATDVLTYNSPKLAKGKKTVKIVATDEAGNVRTASWYFTIK